MRLLRAQKTLKKTYRELEPKKTDERLENEPQTSLSAQGSFSLDDMVLFLAKPQDLSTQDDSSPQETEATLSGQTEERFSWRGAPSAV